MINFKKLFNIPNILSMFRIILIPVFIITYFNNGDSDYNFRAAAILLISGLTDTLDGIIARKFNMITSIGKLLDPLADKLTQVAVVVCLLISHHHNKYLMGLLSIFIIKEAIMLIASAFLLKKKYKPEAALWFGKVGTILFYALMFIIIVYPGMSSNLMTVLVAIPAGFMVFALVKYVLVFLEIIGKKQKKERRMFIK